MASVDTGPYLGVVNASGDEEKSIGKLTVSVFQRRQDRLCRRSPRRDMEPFCCTLQGCCYSIALLLDRQNSTGEVLLLVCHCYSIVGGGKVSSSEAFTTSRDPEPF